MCTFPAPVQGVQGLLSPLSIWQNKHRMFSVTGFSPPQPEAVGVCGSGGCLNWDGLSLLCSTNTQAFYYLCYAMSKGCLTQQQYHLQGVQRRTVLQIGAQAERGSTAKPGPCCGPHGAVHLCSADGFFCPTAPLFSSFVFLDVHFLFS